MLNEDKELTDNELNNFNEKIKFYDKRYWSYMKSLEYIDDDLDNIFIFQANNKKELNQYLDLYNNYKSTKNYFIIYTNNCKSINDSLFININSTPYCYKHELVESGVQEYCCNLKCNTQTINQECSFMLLYKEYRMINLVCEDEDGEMHVVQEL